MTMASSPKGPSLPRLDGWMEGPNAPWTDRVPLSGTTCRMDTLEVPMMEHSESKIT